MLCSKQKMDFRREGVKSGTEGVGSETFQMPSGKRADVEGDCWVHVCTCGAVGRRPVPAWCWPTPGPCTVDVASDRGTCEPGKPRCYAMRVACGDDPRSVVCGLPSNTRTLLGNFPAARLARLLTTSAMRQYLQLRI